MTLIICKAKHPAVSFEGVDTTECPVCDRMGAEAEAENEIKVLTDSFERNEDIWKDHVNDLKETLLTIRNEKAKQIKLKLEALDALENTENKIKFLRAQLNQCEAALKAKMEPKPNA